LAAKADDRAALAALVAARTQAKPPAPKEALATTDPRAATIAELPAPKEDLAMTDPGAATIVELPAPKEALVITDLGAATIVELPAPREAQAMGTADPGAPTTLAAPGVQEAPLLFRAASGVLIMEIAQPVLLMEDQWEVAVGTPTRTGEDERKLAQAHQIFQRTCMNMGICVIMHYLLVIVSRRFCSYVND